MIADQPANLPVSPAAEHLADARLHLRRCLIEIRAAVAADPRMCMPLGTPHAQLVEALARLERVSSSNHHPYRS